MPAQSVEDWLWIDYDFNTLYFRHKRVEQRAPGPNNHAFRGRPGDVFWRPWTHREFGDLLKVRH